MTATAQYPNNRSFTEFRDAIRAQFALMQTLGEVYIVDLEKNALFDFYLDSYPEGTNLLYRERREYDGNYDKSFIRTIGRTVVLHNNKPVSVWNIQIGGYYQVVVDAMKEMVEGAPIKDRFFHIEPTIGVEKNVELNQETGKTKTWTHFYTRLPSGLVKRKDEIGPLKGELRDNFSVLERSLRDITMESAEIVRDLIDQKSLYKGDEKKHLVEAFIKAKKAYDKVPPHRRVNFCWKESETLGKAGRFRNDVIGTLLSDLSEGVELEVAVKKFEDKVSGTNYKRPTALVTTAMVKKAQQKVEELGLQDALARRFAVAPDLTINNVLFADRTAKVQMNAFDVLAKESKGSPKNLDKVEEISIEDFITNVLPKAGSIEVLVENRLTPNLVSLLAPANEGAPNLFQWNNGFSWSYNGEVTDSIKEKVKAAGGRVDGALRVSLSWTNSDDLDLHMHGPKGSHVYYSRAHRRANGAFLDLDMNGMDKHDDINPVENIIWEDENRIDEGVYRIVVNQYNKRMNDREGFVVELDFKGQVYTFNYPKAHRSGNVEVLTFKYSKKGGVEIIDSIGHTKQSKEVWGMNTESFQKVSLVMNSPNFWDGQTNGNKHYFFMLEGCVNPSATRGFYNEYLRGELHEHRKVFELLSGKLKAEFTEDQLSGLGFSSTQRNELIVKVTGSFSRTLKIKF